MVYQSWTLYLFLLDFPRQNPHPSLTNFAGETEERGGKSYVFCFEVASAVIHQPAACGAEPRGGRTIVCRAHLPRVQSLQNVWNGVDMTSLIGRSVGGLLIIVVVVVDPVSGGKGQPLGWVRGVRGIDITHSAGISWLRPCWHILLCPLGTLGGVVWWHIHAVESSWV